VAHNFGILPGKVFEYLAANKPIICIGPVGSDADNLLEECGAGRALPYDTYSGMLDHLDSLFAAWRVNSNLDLPAINHAQYSRRALTQRLANLIK
jgi:hypothetical protein